MVALLRFLFVLINRQVNDIYVLYLKQPFKIPNKKEREIEISFFMVYYSHREYTMLTQVQGQEYH